MPEQGTLFDKETLEQLKVERQQWEETEVRKSQQRLPERDNLITTSGVPINRVYTPQDNEWLDYDRDMGLPGEYPYTRGVQPPMYRARFAGLDKEQAEAAPAARQIRSSGGQHAGGDLGYLRAAVWTALGGGAAQRTGTAAQVGRGPLSRYGSRPVGGDLGQHHRPAAAAGEAGAASAA